jgi:hypothetical protein
MISFQEFIKKFDRPIFEVKTVKGKTIKKEKRRGLPQKPTKSPLLLSCEMKVLNEFLTHAWSNLVHYEKSWHNLVLMFRRNSLSVVTGTYQVRWQILERFSKLTSDRLNQVRKLPDMESNIKKRQVTSENVALVISNRKEAAATMATDEFLHILSNDVADAAYRAIKIKQPGLFGASPAEYIKYLLTSEYSKVGISSQPCAALQAHESLRGAYEASRRLAELIGETEGLTTLVLKRESEMYEEVKKHKLGGAKLILKDVKKLLNHHTKCIDEIERLKDTAKVVIPFPLKSSHTSITFEDWLVGEMGFKKSILLLWEHIVIELREQGITMDDNMEFISDIIDMAQAFRRQPSMLWPLEGR